MLLSMTLANYKSVKNPQTISFVALNDRRMDLTKTVEGTDKFNVLKASAIIGANGAGKSTFIRALEAIKDIMFSDKPEILRKHLSNAAFAYGDGRTRPCEISIDVLLDKGNPLDEEKPSIIARYTIKATKERYYEESLYYIINGSKKIMFERLYKDGEYEYRFGKYYRGEKKRQVAKLAENESFLKGAALKGGQTANELYSWLRDSLDVLPLVGYGESAHRIILDALKEHPSWGNQIVNFLLALDITDIYGIKIVNSGTENERVAISHCFVNANGTEAYSQSYMNESYSLRRLILIAVSFFKAFCDKRTIVIDDFGQLLHPYVLCHIIDLFHANDLESQLIVVDCNPALLRKDLLRKDSVWFAEKGEDSSTEYVSLADFRGISNKVSIYDAYLQGVFGALPIESDFCFRDDERKETK